MPEREIIAHDIYKTSVGTIVIFQFPEKTYPKIGMVLKGRNGNHSKITGLGGAKISRVYRRASQIAFGIALLILPPVK